MSTEIIEVIAQEVRYWAEGEAESRDPQNVKDLNSWCAIASGKLWSELTLAGFQPKLHMSAADIGCHVFVTVDDHVIDVTATQFPEYRDVPVLVAHEREVDQWYHESSKEFSTVEELIRYQRKMRWPREQIAWGK